VSEKKHGQNLKRVQEYIINSGMQSYVNAEIVGVRVYDMIFGNQK